MWLSLLAEISRQAQSLPSIINRTGMKICLPRQSVPPSVANAVHVSVGDGTEGKVGSLLWSGPFVCDPTRVQ